MGPIVKPDCKRGFFHHVLNGMCAYGESEGCQLAFGSNVGFHGTIIFPTDSPAQDPNA